MSGIGTTFESTMRTLEVDVEGLGWAHLQTGIDPYDTVGQTALFEALDAWFSGFAVREPERTSLTPRENQPTWSASNGETSFHTDTAYLAEPCGVVALFCVAAAEKGGQNQLFDGLAAVDSLPLGVLTELWQSQWQWRDPRVSPRGLSPKLSILYHRPDGETAIRWCHKDMVGGAGALALLDRVEQCIDAAGQQAETVSLQPGEILVIDNTRTLHNRSAFEGPCHIERLRFWR